MLLIAVKLGNLYYEPEKTTSLRRCSTPRIINREAKVKEGVFMTVLERKLKFTTTKLVGHIARVSEERVGNPINQHRKRLPGLLSTLKENTDLCLKAAELKHEMTA